MDDGVVIGEGVIIDARPASFATRMLGAALDITIQFAVLIALLLVVTGSFDVSGENVAPAVIIAVLVMVMVVVPTTVETLTRGRSVGKLATGIRIVRDDAGPVRLRHSFIRALVGVGELWLTAGTVALFASLTNTKGKRVGDMLAGTYAIRVRGGGTASAPVGMPPQLAGWATTADMRRLPDGLALATRQFLARSGSMHTASRVRVGQDLAGRLEQLVAPGPPLGTPTEMFLMAVLAERRNREDRKSVV